MILLQDLTNGEREPFVRITATEEEHKLINKALVDFIADPMAYDLGEIVEEEDMMEMAEVCENQRKK
ncbi:MAG: imm68 putative immunity domain-containing protein [Roseburia sp.]|nr:imm68 putative immunity domain-containing protein [Roseburia sp.]